MSKPDTTKPKIDREELERLRKLKELALKEKTKITKPIKL